MSYIREEMERDNMTYDELHLIEMKLESIRMCDATDMRVEIFVRKVTMIDSQCKHRGGDLGNG